MSVFDAQEIQALNGGIYKNTEITVYVFGLFHFFTLVPRSYSAAAKSELNERQH